MPNNYSYPTDKERIEAFWLRVDKSGGENACWIWRGALSDGYGTTRWNGPMKKAHRISYELTYGGFPDALYVLHSCDNPRCVNPLHLFLGTAQDNMDDMYRKCRGNPQRGAARHNYKLNDEQVEEIRRKYADGGTTYKTLAGMYGVSLGHIGSIVKRRVRN